MAEILDKTVLEDEVAVSLARAVATANSRALREGFSVAESLISATERSCDGESFWRVTYGPRNASKRRGGDLIIDIAINSGEVQRVLRGQ